MFQVVNSLIHSFFLCLKDSDTRRAILRPALKTFKVYMYALLLSAVFVAVYFFTVGSGESLWMILLSVSGSLVFLIMFPFVVSYVYLSFFCDHCYRVIIGKSMNFETDHTDIIKESVSIGRIILWGFCLLLILFLALFVPLLSVALGGFIFGADIFSQTLSCLNYSYRDQVSYILKHFFSVTGMGMLLLGASVFPFAILLVYPFGVLAAGRFYSVSSVSN
jgi:hypothetical protein